MQVGRMRKTALTVVVVLLALVPSGIGLSDGDEYFSYNQLTSHIHSLARQYPNLVNIGSAGTSVEGRTIWSVTVGKGSRNVVITGSLHASEWITTPVLLRTIEAYAKGYYNGSVINGESVKHILDNYSLTFFPMVNPDGVTLAQEGAAAFPNRRDELLAMNPRGDDFSRWKANIRGVDLNRNYNVRWGLPVSGSSADKPNYAFYGGTSPESEPETQVIADWIRRHKPVLLLDYHSYGDILFWYYLQTGSVLERDRRIVQAMRAYSGYRMEAVVPSVLPSSTLTYWGSAVAKIPSICVELGNRPPNYLRMGDVPGIFNRVKYLPLIAIINLPEYQRHQALEAVSLPETLELALQETELLSPIPSPAGAAVKSAFWVSSNPEVASVNSQGMVTAHGLGQAVITVSVGGLTAVSQVTVLPNRILEAAELSRSGWEHSDTVVIVSAEDSDITFGREFAARLDVPVLLTGSNRLPALTKQEILRLGAKKVYLFDGGDMISTDVDTEIVLVGAEVIRASGSLLSSGSRSAKTPLIQADSAVIVHGFDMTNTLALAGKDASGFFITQAEPGELQTAALQVLRELGAKTALVISGTGKAGYFPGVVRVDGPGSFPGEQGYGEYILIIGNQGEDSQAILLTAP